MSICHIIGAGAYFEGDLQLTPGDLLIAADGGLKTCEQILLKPDLIIGDFDSLGYVPKGADVILPREKDATDVAVCIEEGKLRGYREFHLYGCTGGREDHTYANLQLLYGLALSGCSGTLYFASRKAFTVDGTVTLTGSGYISVFSYREVHVTLRGLKYPLTQYPLSPAIPLGVSNEFTGIPATIMTDGPVLVFTNK